MCLSNRRTRRDPLTKCEYETALIGQRKIKRRQNISFKHSLLTLFRLACGNTAKVFVLKPDVSPSRVTLPCKASDPLHEVTLLSKQPHVFSCKMVAKEY